MDDFDQFVKKAWADHAEEPAQVAARLAEALPDVHDAARIVPYVRLVGHVHGEHLGRWDEGVALLETLREQAIAAEPTAVAAIEAAIGALRFCADANAPLGHLPPTQRAAALASAAAMLTGRNDLYRAIAALDDAHRVAPADLAPGAPAVRALAIAGNNLAAALEEELPAGAEVPIDAVRAGGYVGMHTVLLASDYERLSLTHESFSRRAFVEGALTAAEFIVDRIGWYEMEDVLGMRIGDLRHQKIVVPPRSDGKKP